MKKIIILALAGFLMLVLSCSEESEKPPVSVLQPAEIHVSRTDFELTGNTAYDKVSISNSGTEPLTWQITDKPAWLLISKTSGEITHRPDTLILDIDWDLVAEEKVSGVVKFESNGGSFEMLIQYDNSSPTLFVWLPIIYLSRNRLDTDISIYNRGGKELNWEVISTPNWVSVSQSAGTTRIAPTPVTLVADLSQLNYGIYQDEITFQSNGGFATVQVNLVFEREIEVFPGMGAAKIDIGRNYGTIKKVHGAPEILQFDKISKDYYRLRAQYVDKGLTFKFAISSTLVSKPDSKQTNYIYLQAPYDGLTEQMIGIGSSLTDVTNAYGEPQEIIDETIYVYTSGVAFHFDSVLETVEGISIFADRADFVP
ncbi:hypothetical protein JW935_09025 [candidate division KSB1 bacterium]|nr:hypothetical protein [candidate division KSB1 bacterium]